MGLTTKILKLLRNDISSKLADIIKISFSTDAFPTIIKVTKLVPVDKKHFKLDFSNYLPISLLSNTEQIKKLTYNKIYNFFTINNLIYPLKFGFRQHYSNSNAIISLTEDIKKKNLDKGNIGYGIFVDLQKAFDTVEHDILLAKLEHYDIHDVLNEWFKSYLFDRKQFASINGHVSNKDSIKYGVPQGSVL